jgi:hypothetical protein
MPDSSKMIYDRKRLADTLSEVLFVVYEHWPELPASVQARIETLRQELARDLPALSNANDRSNRIIQFLQALEQIPEVAAVAHDAFSAGKLAGPVRSFGGPNASETSELVERLTIDPALVYEAQPAMRSSQAPSTPPSARMEPANGETEEAAIESASPEGEDVDLHTKIDFPEQIRPLSEHPLIIQLTLEEPTESRVKGIVSIRFPEPREPEIVEVRVTAPGFTETTGVWSRTMAVYSYQDSQPAVFLLKAPGQPGEHRITVDFYHRGRNVGTFAFNSRVSAFGAAASTRSAPGTTRLSAETVAAGPTSLTAFAGIRLPESPPPPVDVELRIVTGNRPNELHFILHSALAHVGYHWRDMGSVQLTAENPAQYLEKTFWELSQLAAQPVDNLTEADARVNEDRIRSIGEQLYLDLFPAPLKREYWRIKELRDAGKLSSLLITSDEPSIPWELVKPYEYDQDSGEERDDDFLAGGFQLSRWLAGRGPADRVAIRAARLVAPVLDLAFVEDEVKYFAEQLPAAGVDAGTPIKTRAEVLGLARTGGVQLVHFAAHGRFEPQHADRSPLSLQDGEITPADFRGSGARGLRRDRPIFFLNTCHSARIAFVLTGLGGWAETLVAELGVSAFIGTHWEVNDLLAAEFATHFYDCLGAGQPLGEAFHNARQKIRQRQPANPTWLAYALYGDPNSRVIFQGSQQEPVDGDEP